MREWKATQGANGVLAPNDWWNLTLYLVGRVSLVDLMLAHRLVSSHLPASHLTMCSPLCLMPKFHVLIPHTPLSCVSTPQVYTIQCHFTPSPFNPHLQYPTPHTVYPHPSYQHPTPHTLTLRINTPTLHITPPHPHPSIHHTLSLSHPLTLYINTHTPSLNTSILIPLTYPPHVSHLLPPYGITPHTSPSHLNASHHNTHLYTTTSPSHLRTSLHALHSHNHTP